MAGKLNQISANFDSVQVNKTDKYHAYSKFYESIADKELNSLISSIESVEQLNKYSLIGFNEKMFYPKVPTVVYLQCDRSYSPNCNQIYSMLCLKAIKG